MCSPSLQKLPSSHYLLRMNSQVNESIIQATKPTIGSRHQSIIRSLGSFSRGDLDELEHVLLRKTKRMFWPWLLRSSVLCLLPRVPAQNCSWQPIERRTSDLEKCLNILVLNCISSCVALH
jgi:hypothetical protein